MSSKTSTFLTVQELRELTGYLVRNKQARWLAAKGWPFELDRFNRPVVLRSVMECRLSESDPEDGFTLDEANIA